MCTDLYVKVKVGIYLTSMSDYKTMNDAYAEVFTQGAKPVCCETIESSCLI